MTEKKPKAPRRSGMDFGNAAQEQREGDIPGRTVYSDAFRKQADTTNAIRRDLELPKWKRDKKLADKRRPRLIIDLSRFIDYDLDRKVDELCREWDIPPSHFIALCIQRGLDDIDNKNLNLDEYVEQYEGGRNRQYTHALHLGTKK